MMRFIPIRKNELLSDAAGVARMLEKSRLRRPLSRLVSLCGTAGDTLIAVLEETADGEIDERELVFSPLNEDTGSYACVTSAILSRYESGYSTLATFPVDKTMWGLFCREKRG